MSRLRPSHRDRLEKQLIVLAKERADIDAGFVEQMLAIQKKLAVLEGGGGVLDERPVAKNDSGPRLDDMDTTPEAQLQTYGPGPVLIEDEPADEVIGGTEFDSAADAADWRGRCNRITNFAVTMFSQIAMPEEKRPKLAAHVALHALGVPALPSKRDIAAAHGLSPEWVSRRVEVVIERFKLPRNEYNKPMAAVEKYQGIAALRNYKESA